MTQASRNEIILDRNARRIAQLAAVREPEPTFWKVLVKTDESGETIEHESHRELDARRAFDRECNRDPIVPRLGPTRVRLQIKPPAGGRYLDTETWVRDA